MSSRASSRKSATFSALSDDVQTLGTQTVAGSTVRFDIGQSDGHELSLRQRHQNRLKARGVAVSGNEFSRKGKANAPSGDHGELYKKQLCATLKDRLVTEPTAASVVATALASELTARERQTALRAAQPTAGKAVFVPSTHSVPHRDAAEYVRAKELAAKPTSAVLRMAAEEEAQRIRDEEEANRARRTPAKIRRQRELKFMRYLMGTAEHNFPCFDEHGHEIARVECVPAARPDAQGSSARATPAAKPKAMAPIASHAPLPKVRKSGVHDSQSTAQAHSSRSCRPGSVMSQSRDGSDKQQHKKTAGGGKSQERRGVQSQPHSRSTPPVRQRPGTTMSRSSVKLRNDKIGGDKGDNNNNSSSSSSTKKHKDYGLAAWSFPALETHDAWTSDVKGHFIDHGFDHCWGAYDWGLKTDMEVVGFGGMLFKMKDCLPDRIKPRPGDPLWR